VSICCTNKQSRQKPWRHENSKKTQNKENEPKGMCQRTHLYTETQRKTKKQKKNIIPKAEKETKNDTAKSKKMRNEYFSHPFGCRLPFLSGLGCFNFPSCLLCSCCWWCKYFDSLFDRYRGTHIWMQLGGMMSDISQKLIWRERA